MTEEDNFITLEEKLQDGSIDDLAGEGYWHIEKMKEGVFSLTVGNDDNYKNYIIESEKEDLTVTEKS